MTENRLQDLYDHADRIRASIEEAYKRGYADARKQILDALNSPPALASKEDSTQQESSPNAPRAPKGLMRKLIKDVLHERSGLAASEIGREVTKRDDRVSERSVGTELRRGEEDGTYERQGGLWYLRENTKHPDPEIERLLS